MADESDIGPEDTFEKKLEEGVRRLNEAVLQEEVARTEMRDVEIEVRELKTSVGARQTELSEMWRDMGLVANIVHTHGKPGIMLDTSAIEKAPLEDSIDLPEVPVEESIDPLVLPE